MAVVKTMDSKIQAIAAAIFFGASTPVSKLLLGDIDPILLAAFLYLGCGFGISALRVLQKITGKQTSKEAGLSSKDIPWLAGAIFSGGVAAPIILMLGLKATPASTASLLLNFEGAATGVIAAIAFKEALGKRVWASIVFITAASILLTWEAKGDWGFSAGAAGVIMACVFWGMDNNFTRNISAKDPLTIVALKGMIAGTVSLVIAFSTGSHFPAVRMMLAALILGFFSYGVSIMLFIYAMRGLGAARASAFFGSAPFVGTILSLILFREWPGINFIISLPVMIAGAALILWEKHAHVHRHEPFSHDHSHTHHDGHHNHPHAENGSAKHTHSHLHEAVEHEHFHTPDIHHRHGH